MTSLRASEVVWGSDGVGNEVQTWFREDAVLVQDDHVFSSSLLGDAAHVAWSVADAVLNLRLSDHAPLIIDFDVESIAMTNLAES